MPLLADLVGLFKPGRDFVIYVIHVLEPKGVEMISRRKSLDAPETRMLEAARQDDMAVHPISANDERSETHPHLKCDPRFLGQDSDRAIFSGDRKQLVEDGAHRDRFAFEMRGQRGTAAGMRLIAIGESTAALWAAPERPQT